MMIEANDITVLLVDDDDVDVECVRRAFKRLDIRNQLVVAKNGVQALECLRGVGSNLINKPYILLVDLNMPKMGGLELLREIRADKVLSSTVAFVLTTSALESDIKEAYRLNIAGYMLKQEAGNAFLEAIEMLKKYLKIVNFQEG